MLGLYSQTLILKNWIKKFKIKTNILQRQDGTEFDKNDITKILYKIFN